MTLRAAGEVGKCGVLLKCVLKTMPSRESLYHCHHYLLLGCRIIHCIPTTFTPTFRVTRNVCDDIHSEVEWGEARPGRGESSKRGVSTDKGQEYRSSRGLRCAEDRRVVLWNVKRLL